MSVISLVSHRSMARLVAILLCAGLAASLSGCARSAANMAATQPEARDLTVLKKGTPRDKVVARLGAPETTTERGEMSAEVYKFVQGYSGGARTARVFAHSTMSIATLGLWEVAGTAIEGYARGTEVSIRAVYDKHRLLESYEILDGEDAVDTEVRAGAAKTHFTSVAVPSAAVQQPSAAEPRASNGWTPASGPSEKVTTAAVTTEH